jgi:hypothetical protein
MHNSTLTQRIALHKALRPFLSFHLTHVAYPLVVASGNTSVVAEEALGSIRLVTQSAVEVGTERRTTLDFLIEAEGCSILVEHRQHGMLARDAWAGRG